MIVVDQANLPSESSKNSQGISVNSPPQVASVSFQKSTGLIEQDIPKPPPDVSKLQSTSFKRVSFGNTAKTDLKVQTFVYETGSESNEQLNDHKRHSYPPTDSLSKLKVELVDCDLPCSIEPPSEIGYILNDGTVAAASSLTSSVNSSVVLTTTAVPPEIPSRKRMADHENPFRPDGSLCNEVEPIVEEFKHKPFRQITAHSGPPLPAHAVGGPSSAATSPDGKTVPEPTIPECVASKTVEELSKSGAELSKSPKSAKESTKTAKKPSDINIIAAAADQTDAAAATGGQKIVAQVEHKMLLSPKAAQAEMVHLEDRDMKKPKCGACCVIQ